MARFAWMVIVLTLTVPCSCWAGTLELSVQEPSGVDRHSWPVTSGIPLAEGALADDQACMLVDENGREVPLQTEALARWPDGSVRWLLLDFQVDLPADASQRFSLRYGEDTHRRAVTAPLQVLRDGDRIRVDTGPLRMVTSAAGSSPLGAVWIDANADGQFSDQERVVSAESSTIELEDAAGGQFVATAEGSKDLVIEQAGPLRSCVCVRGHHRSPEGQMFGYVLRIHAYRGQPYLRLYYTFINDYQASLMAQVKHVTFAVGLDPAAGKVTGSSLAGLPDGRERLVQVDDQRFRLDPGGERSGHVPGGWAVVAGSRAGLALGLREFWQNWPKSVSCQERSIRLGICPEFEPGTYDGRPLEEENKLYYQLRGGVHTFKCGVAKTHELWATFFANKVNVAELQQFFTAAEQPLLATCPPKQVSTSNAAGEFPPADPAKYFGYDMWLNRALQAHLQRRDQVREYGMLNYGDWYGERSVNWGNLEYDLAHGLFLQYLRTGDRRFFARAEQAARHHIDVDVVHAVNSHLENPWGDPPRVGDIWLHCLNHTGGYYEDTPLPVSRTYHMGHSTNFGHVWNSGDLDYYYLTGDRRAREVALEVADAMVSHMPTRYGTHIRALGWPMILVLAAYDATGDQRYLDAATKNWEVLKNNINWQRGWVVQLAGDHCLHPPGSTREERQTKYRDQRCEGNVPFMEGLTCCALARYHRVTQDPEVLKALTVGIDQMIRECWQEDVKTFRYTACTLSNRTPYCLFMLSTEAMAYEIARTGNQEHRRILREGVRAAIPEGDGNHFGKNLAQMIFFTPHGLQALEE